MGVVALSLALGGCATVDPGHVAIVEGMRSRARAPLQEGSRVIGPFASVVIYDLRAQQRSEDFEALSADGMRLEAKASVMTYHPVADEIGALARETGPDYYQVLIAPTVRSRLRRLLASYRADALDTPTVDRIEKQIARETAELLRPRHIVFDAIGLRTLRIDPRSQAYAGVVQTGVEQQKAMMAAQALVELARRDAERLRLEAKGVAEANTLVAPTLTPPLLRKASVDGWSNLLTSPSTQVRVLATEQPYLLEVAP